MGTNPLVRAVRHRAISSEHIYRWANDPRRWGILTRVLRLSKSDLNSWTVLALRYGVAFQRLGAAVCL